MNIEKSTATTGSDLIARIQQAAIERGERGKPEGRNHVQQFFYEAAQQPEVICAWHPQFHSGETLVMQEGDKGKISHGLCSVCAEKMAEGVSK
jgi:hypothetical protein